MFDSQSFAHSRSDWPPQRRRKEQREQLRQSSLIFDHNTAAMPGPSNTLLIEGSFSELAEELAHYLDTLAKSEEGAGVSADVAQFLDNIRESEQSEEPVDESSVQQQKDEVLKKIVTKASVLNSAPERGTTLCLEEKSIRTA